MCPLTSSFKHLNNPNEHTTIFIEYVQHPNHQPVGNNYILLILYNDLSKLPTQGL
jgi:hypothetical protein